MVEARRLRKSFARSLAVDDVSFQIRRGEVLGLLGPNGAGKTTTLRLLLQILAPDSGEVLYDGDQFSPDKRNVMGYLPEERGLYRKGTLLNTISHFAKLRGVPGLQAREQTRVWLHQFGLGGDENRQIQELSKGNQQKAQFIVAVVHDPWLVVLDEPFSGLDPLNQVFMQETIGKLRTAGKAIILSTHQMEYAEKLSDTLCLIHEGKVLLSGRMDEVKKPYRTNRLRVEFRGESSLPPTLPGVSDMIRFPGGIECKLDPGVGMDSLLVKLMQHGDVRKCELVEPNLQSVFMDVVHKQTVLSRGN